MLENGWENITLSKLDFKQRSNQLSEACFEKFSSSPDKLEINQSLLSNSIYEHILEKTILNSGVNTSILGRKRDEVTINDLEQYFAMILHMCSTPYDLHQKFIQKRTI